jgi:hypothetical protein
MSGQSPSPLPPPFIVPVGQITTGGTEIPLPHQRLFRIAQRRNIETLEWMGAGRGDGRGGGGGCAAEGRGDGRAEAVEACSLDKMKKFLLRKGQGYFLHTVHAECKRKEKLDRI